jgi:hexulose-6-phosphate isomerase
MIKTINAWAFAPTRPLPEVFRLAKNHGFDAIELTVAETGSLSLSSTENDCREIAAQAREAGLAVSSLASGLGWSYPMTATDPEIARKGVEATARSLQIAKWLGVDAILVVPGGVSASFIPGFHGAPYDVAYANALSALKELAPVAEELQVTIAVENVWNQFLLSPLEFRGFLDEIGSAQVKSYFDVGNVLLTGSPEQWIRILGSRIARVHFKDFKRSVGTIDGFCGLLEGDVDYPAVISALAETGYDGYVTAEFFDCEKDLGSISAAMDRILGR